MSEEPVAIVEAQEVNFASSVSEFASDVVNHVRKELNGMRADDLKFVVQSLCRAACDISTLSGKGLVVIQHAEGKDSMQLWYVHNTPAVCDDPDVRLDYILKELKHHAQNQPEEE